MEWHFPLILLNRRTFSWKTDVFSVLKFVFFWYWKQSGNGLGLISLDESFFNNNSVCLTDYLRFSRLVLRARGYRLASLSDRIGSDRICLISLADSFFSSAEDSVSRADLPSGSHASLTTERFPFLVDHSSTKNGDPFPRISSYRNEFGFLIFQQGARVFEYRYFAVLTKLTIFLKTQKV